MAKQVTVTIVDDYDGKSEAAETVHFSVDGTEYEIDLSTLNAGKFRSAMEPWATKARKQGRIPRSKIGGKARPAVDREQTVAIRRWALEHGHKVSARGRISSDIIEAYNKTATT